MNDFLNDIDWCITLYNNTIIHSNRIVNRQLYQSNKSRQFNIQKLILKPSIQQLLLNFFDIEQSFDLVLLLWDCQGIVALENVGVLHISNQNTRKLYRPKSITIPKGIYGALNWQLFVVESINPIILKRLDKSFLQETNRTFNKIANAYTEQLAIAVGNDRVQELIRQNIPSVALDQENTSELNLDNTFYCTQIKIEP